MKTYTFQFRSNSKRKLNIKNDLEMFITCGVKYASAYSISGKFLTISFICEDSTLEDCMSDINLFEADKWNIELYKISR